MAQCSISLNYGASCQISTHVFCRSFKMGTRYSLISCTSPHFFFPLRHKQNMLPLPPVNRDILVEKMNPPPSTKRRLKELIWTLQGFLPTSRRRTGEEGANLNLKPLNAYVVVPFMETVQSVRNILKIGGGWHLSI